MVFDKLTWILKDIKEKKNDQAAEPIWAEQGKIYWFQVGCRYLYWWSIESRYEDKKFGSQIRDTSPPSEKTYPIIFLKTLSKTTWELLFSNNLTAMIFLVIADASLHLMNLTFSFHNYVPQENSIHTEFSNDITSWGTKAAKHIHNN